LQFLVRNPLQKIETQSEIQLLWKTRAEKEVLQVVPVPPFETAELFRVLTLLLQGSIMQPSRWLPMVDSLVTRAKEPTDADGYDQGIQHPAPWSMLQTCIVICSRQ
tara:strand:- start:121 stop:438 length:318 start_codon:yes stop_codon:yes gene_type:complete